MAQRLPLPIDPLLPQLVQALEKGRSVVLEAPPGAGKTTRVPPALWASGLGKGGQIVMLEPRRIAARAAARRIAQEQGWRLGDQVGYRIRFENKAGPKTRILVVTEGVLLQMLQRDPFLEGVACLIFDEFHERNLDSDLALAMARRVQQEARDDLRLVVMSATLDAAPIARYLDDCACLESRGRSYPVDVQYLDMPDPRPLATATAHAVRRALTTTEGHLLVFLPGVGEIHKTAELLAAWQDLRGFAVHRLFGDLPSEQQDAVLSPSAGRKIILSTNVAETSVTIDGVGTVIDSGWARRLRFDPAHGLDRLQLVRISAASATQRAGRAGRQGPGTCLRLWTEHDHRSLQDRDLPEIQRLDLSPPLLQLYAWGESDPRQFEWLEKPPADAVERAHRLLEDLGALDHRQGSGSLGRHGHGWTLSDIGQAMSRFGAHPRLARLLIEGQRLGIDREASLAAALLSERDIVNRPSGHRRVVAMRSSSSDLVDRLDALDDFHRSGYGETALGPVHPARSRHIRRVAEQLRQQAQRRKPRNSSNSEGAAAPEASVEVLLRRALLAAFPDRLTRRREKGSRRGVMVGGRGARLAEMSSVTEGEFFLSLETDGGSQGRSDVLVRQASAVEMAWLDTDQLRTVTEAFFDLERQKALATRKMFYRDLCLEEVEVDPGAEEGARVLAQFAVEHLDLVLPADDRELTEFLARLDCLRDWMPQLALPSFDDATWHDLVVGLCSGLRSLAELRRLPWHSILEGTLNHAQQQALKRFAPAALEVPSGNRIRLQYVRGKAPVLAVRIQELFGLNATPCVAQGRQPVLLHLLAPNFRPQQVTDDLPSFWHNTYPEVRKELKGRYAKHAWPEDPLSAKAESKPGRRRSKPSSS